jgi:glycerophosphoryl diester phosphodiesterase
METPNIFIAHPETQEQINALKAFVKALKIKFEIKEKPYDPEFVNMVMEADDEIKKGKGIKVTSSEFDELWK